MRPIHRTLPARVLRRRISRPATGLLVFFLTAAIAAIAVRNSNAQAEGSRYFPETGHSVKGAFLDYWEAHGGLAQQGFPISEEFTEVSDLDGKTYTVQYFERAVFEMHPENPEPHNVLLSQLGTFQYKAKYGEGGAPNQQPNTQNGQLFSETGFYVGGAFLDYWKAHGGLPQQGFPISNEFTELSELDGKQYTVQYFERAVFEMHPENPEPHNVLLSQLGTFQLKKKYPGGPPGGGAQPPPTAPPNPQPNPQPTNTSPGTNCDPVPDSRKSAVTNTGPVAILNVQYSGQEYVELRNTGGTAIDLGGWILRDKNDNDQQYPFAEGTQLAAGATLQVYTEPGHPYTFNSRGSIWNNCGDAIELLDNTGAVVATYAYGTHLK